jgi:ABC-type multidrug transport system fused ATPase/permease subunit
VLVLDEATSSLDTLTERLITDSMRAMRGRCTTLVVAHRLSTVMDAEQTVVLERGRVRSFACVLFLAFLCFFCF